MDNIPRALEERLQKYFLRENMRLWMTPLWSSSIDEVQRAKEMFRYIKMKCDEREDKGLFSLSGSQPFHLMQNVSESLSGRIGIRAEKVCKETGKYLGTDS